MLTCLFEITPRTSTSETTKHTVRAVTIRSNSGGNLDVKLEFIALRARIKLGLNALKTQKLEHEF